MPLKVGISSCLLGEQVRYDGGHKLNHYLRDILGCFVQWVPLCPEFECGLSIPREAMRLVGDPDQPRLITIRSGIDLTDKMEQWIDRQLKHLEQEPLCGFIFKKSSPSCGSSGVKVYTEKGFPSRQGMGLFAKAFIGHFPLIPIEDEGRLHDDQLRENFIERIFVYYRWREVEASGSSFKSLVEFHTRHKLLIMAHSPKLLKELGQLLAQHPGEHEKILKAEYIRRLMEGLKLIATVKKNTNVLEHMMGYFKKVLSPDEKQELRQIISQYHGGLAPLIVPITLLNHYVRKYRQDYLSRQFYLNPYPAELLGTRT